jgi:peptide/nickel transport system substrate-binding protein
LRPRPSRAGAFGLLALAAVAVVVAGCGGDEDEGTPALSAGEPLGEGGTLVWTVADSVSTIDPLIAATRSERLVSRQIHEPLLAAVAGPFGDTRRIPGLARSARASGDDTIWTLRLRTGVRFQDGTPFNAEAVVANAERWRTTAAGAAALPGVVDAFAPRPDVVRFILSAPDQAFDERLADPRLGIVSPAALRPSSGTAAEMFRARQTGTGPFELRESNADRQLLARNTSWWGTAREGGLGPALEQIEFRRESSASVRLALLDAGDVQLADELGADQAEQALADPLLNALRGAGGTWLGLSRAVRGVDSALEIPSLSSAWLANVTVVD